MWHQVGRLRSLAYRKVVGRVVVHVLHPYKFKAAPGHTKDIF